MLLASGFAIYSAYGHRFYAGFLAECRDVADADLNDAGNGTPTIDWLYAFLIGALPVALTSRVGLRIIVGVFLTYDLAALLSLHDPYAGSDCGIHSGNDQDFTGNYVLFQLGYALLLLATYVIMLADLATQGLRSLRR